MPRGVIKLSLGLLSFLIAFSVYLMTLSGSIAAGDSTEMVTAAISLGIPHQPGYPLNNLLGNIGVNFPLDINPIFKVNAVSAFLQASAVFVFYFLMIELLEHLMTNNDNDDDKEKDSSIGQYLISFTASLFLGFSLVFWQYATKFEVFALNNLFAITILLITFLFMKKPLAREEENKGKVSLRKNVIYICLGIVTGLAFTHHQTIILIAPPVFVLAIKKVYENIELLKGKLLFLIPSFFVGFSVYFFLFWFYSRINPEMNWGNVKGVVDAFPALARSDFGTFSAYLRGTEETARTYPIDQLIYYIKNININFTFFGVIFAGVGFWYLFKKSKILFLFVFLGVFTAGILFTSIAGFPISDAFNQATLLRFYMLPNIFISLAIGVGLWYLYNLFSKVKVEQKEQRIGSLLIRLYLVLSFSYLIFVNYAKADIGDINITKKYAYDAFATTPENSLILVSGDIPNMAADYITIIEGQAKNRLIFTPGQFHLAWFREQLAERYPALTVPLPPEGKRFTTTTQVVDANYEKAPIFVSPELSEYDSELAEKYVLYPRNTLFEVKKKGDDLKLEDFRRENETLFNSLDLDQIKKIQKNTPMFEETVIFYYARHFHNSGFMFEEVGLYEDAITEHKRVLKIDPFFKDSLAALGRLYGYKLEYPDYYTAIDYFQKYQSVLEKDERELGEEAQYLIEELRMKMLEDVDEEVEVPQESATNSGEVGL